MFQLLRFILLGIVVSTLAACASSPQQNNSSAGYTDEFVGDFLKAKLRKNGEYLFCDQSGYTACYAIPHSQCLKEISAVKENCFRNAEAKFPNQFTSAQEGDEFAKFYSVCLVFQHAATTDAKRSVNEIANCLKSFKPDVAQRDKSLLR